MLISGLVYLTVGVSPAAAGADAGTAVAPTSATPVLEWGGVKIQAEIGFGGQFRPGRFAPLRLMVENAGPSIFHGFAGLTVVRPAGISGENHETYRAEVLAGTPARLELPFVIPLRSSYDRLILQLWDHTGRLVAESQLILPQLPQKQSLWLVLRYQPATSPWLALLVAAANRLEPDFPVFTAYVNDVSKLPADPVAFDGIDLVILDDISLRQLPSQAATAIQAWVSRGGLLLVTGAAEERNAGAWPWKGEFLPIDRNNDGSNQSGQKENSTVSWLRFGKGKVAFWPGRLESSLESRPEEAAGNGDTAITEVLRLRQNIDIRPLLPTGVPLALPAEPAAATDLDGVVTAVLRKTPLTGTRVYLVGVVLLLYALVLAAMWRRVNQRLGFRRWFAAGVVVWTTTMAGTAVFAHRENARLVRAGSQVVEVGIGSTGRPWQDTRIFVSVPHPGHPAAIPIPAAYSAALPVGSPGSWQLTWNLQRQALLYGNEGILALSWSRLTPAPLSWNWHSATEPYLEIVNPLPDTLWLLGLAAWRDRVVTAAVNPGGKVMLPFPAAGLGDPAGSSRPTVRAAASELSARLLPALLNAELPLPTRRAWAVNDPLRLARTLWQHTHTELIRLALEEGGSAGSTRLRRDPVLLVGLGLPLQPGAGAQDFGPSGNTAAIVRLLALWVEPPTYEPPPKSEPSPELQLGVSR